MLRNLRSFLKKNNLLQVIMINLVILLAFIFSFVFFLRITRQIVRDSTERYTIISADTLEATLGRLNRNSALQMSVALEPYFKEFYENNGVEAFLVDKYGQVLVSESEDYPKGSNVHQATGRVMKDDQHFWRYQGLFRIGGSYYLFRRFMDSDNYLVFVNDDTMLFGSVQQQSKVMALLLIFTYMLSTAAIMILIRLYRKQLIYVATTDELTGLANRKAFIVQYERLRKEERLRGNVMFMIDADRFKRINDSYGHAAGDRVLAFIARKIQEFSNGQSIAGRWGGDEFIGVFVAGKYEAEDKLKKLIQEVAETVQLPENFQISISVGAARIGDNTDLNYNMKQADNALYLSKKNGRGQLTMANGNKK